jgi:YVTN family beta-propeller protein
VLMAAGGAVAGIVVDGGGPAGTDEVGQTVDGATLLPDNQFVSPVGDRIEVANGRMISSALSPDGTKLAALTSSNVLGHGLTIFDLQAKKIVQQVGVVGGSSSAPVGDGEVAADGPLYSRDGKTLWMSQATDILRFTVKADGTVDPTPAATIPLTAGHHGPFSDGYSVFSPSGDALPSGMALSADGKELYVALNANNTLGIIDTSTNKLAMEIPVGNAPRQVVVRWPYAFVSNEGGRPARRGDVTNRSDYTDIVADPVTGAASTGTVSVVDLRSHREVREITVGLGPAAMVLRDRALFVANTNGDSVSVIDVKRQVARKTIHVQPLPGVPVGSHVNAIYVPDRTHLLLSLGRDNAIAEYSYTGMRKPVRLLGMIPTDWYPVAIQQSSALGGKLVVTSGKGRGARGLTGSVTIGGTTPPSAYITHLETSSVETFPLPDDPTLARDTERVRKNNGWDRFADVNSGAGDTVPSVIPPKLGMPSVIKHVVLIVKENRTYDQVLGDLGTGNGDPALAQFGAAVTPNMHALAKRFGDLDNFYDEGTLSADGHNWIVQADANDYVESSFGTFARSYPASGADALAYQRSGFLWDKALENGLDVRNYGEYLNFFSVPASGGPTWQDWYRDSEILEGKASGPLPVPIDKYRSTTDVPALDRVTNEAFPLFDLDIPDQYRVDIWERDFKADVASGKFPNLTLMTIMSDHTAIPQSSGGSPNPVAEVADNDLALGRVVSDISHSPLWASTAIFVAEDDSQAGVDHVDGHRAPMFVISPYSKPGVDSYYYSQLNMVRTIEQILGLAPLNQGDANAAPMYNAFTEQPDATAYETQPNLVPLDLGAGTPVGTNALAAGARPPAAVPRRWRRLVEVPASQRRTVAAWTAWGRHQHFGGAHPRPDYANPVLLNHYDWYAAHGWRTPYPGERRIATPAELLRRG